MKTHWRYLRYVLRHKRFVFEAGLKRGVPLWQLIVHDLSKFRPDEWCAYAEWFYGWDGRWPRQAKEFPHDTAAQQRRQAMLAAFLRHLHRNPHHHQYWRLLNDGTSTEVVFPIPERYAREMLADWDGAGRAITGTADTRSWYAKNRDRMVLDPATRAWVERELEATR